MTKENPDRAISVEIMEIETQTITFRLIGRTPLICNRQSEKTKRTLLLPPLPKNKAQRAQTLKHDPLEEFRASVYRNRDPNRPALLHLPGGAFKQATAGAALDIPGATKAQIGRLVSLVSTQVDLFGLPYLKADTVRQAGPSRTPDVRFRACFAEWVVELTFEFVPAIISAVSIANLVNAAGLIRGVGDWRVEKGSGDFGKFRIVPEDDPDWHRIVEEGGRDAQQAALDMPMYFDDDTRDLVEWFNQEIELRRKMPEIAVVARRKKGSEEGKTQ